MTVYIYTYIYIYISKYSKELVLTCLSSIAALLAQLGHQRVPGAFHSSSYKVQCYACESRPENGFGDYRVGTGIAVVGVCIAARKQVGMLTEQNRSVFLD
jgi:hypothetical protein